MAAFSFDVYWSPFLACGRVTQGRHSVLALTSSCGAHLFLQLGLGLLKLTRWRLRIDGRVTGGSLWSLLCAAQGCCLYQLLVNASSLFSQHRHCPQERAQVWFSV